MGESVDSRQWVQPLFMVYDCGTDERVPLTQERLDQLIAVERQYGMMIKKRLTPELAIAEVGAMLAEKDCITAAMFASGLDTPIELLTMGYEMIPYHAPDKDSA